MRWKDRVKKDMVALAVLSHWYVAAQDRKLWHDRYCAGMERAVERRIVGEWEKWRASSLLGGSSALPFTCHQCNRSFRRQETCGDTSVTVGEVELVWKHRGQMSFSVAPAIAPLGGQWTC